MAARQPKWSATAPVSTRPAMPPNAVPPTYRPIAMPSPCGCTSSARYAIATAGTPPSTTPSNARVASNPCQPGSIAAANVNADDSTSDTPISVLR